MQDCFIWVEMLAAAAGSGTTTTTTTHVLTKVCFFTIFHLLLSCFLPPNLLPLCWADAEWWEGNKTWKICAGPCDQSLLSPSCGVISPDHTITASLHKLFCLCLNSESALYVKFILTRPLTHMWKLYLHIHTYLIVCGICLGYCRKYI